MTFIDPNKVPKRTLYTGVQMPAVGMGTFGKNNASPKAVAEAVLGGIHVGYRSFDCASYYGNEDTIGEAFEQAVREGSVKRDELFIASKLWNDMHGDGDVLLSCAQTLKDLRLDYLDLYYIHWPFPNDLLKGGTPGKINSANKPFSVERFMRTWHQMERLVDMGLVRHLGMSNMTIPKLEAVLPLCRIKPAALEVELHPCFQQQDIFEYCQEKGIVVVDYCPLGAPQPEEKRKLFQNVAVIDLPELRRIAEAHGVHPAVICIKWAVQRGTVPIPSSLKERNYTMNLQCTTEDPLAEEEMEIIKGLDCNRRLVKGTMFLWEGARDWHDLWDEEGVIVQ